MSGVTPTVRRTSSGNGAMIVVNESDQELAERQRRRQSRVAALQRHYGHYRLPVVPPLDLTQQRIAQLEADVINLQREVGTLLEIAIRNNLHVPHERTTNV